MCRTYLAIAAVMRISRSPPLSCVACVAAWSQAVGPSRPDSTVVRAIALGSTCVASAMPVEVEVNYTVKCDDRVWRVAPREMYTVQYDGSDHHFVRLTSRGFARVCFDEMPSSWATRSDGIRHITRLRNQAAFDQLAVQAALFAMPTPAPKRPRQKLLEMRTKRLEKDALEVEMPSVDLMGGNHVGQYTITLLRPIHPTDALWVEMTSASIAYCVDVVVGMGLDPDGMVREELPKGCTNDGKRYICRWYDEGEHRLCYKTYRPTADSDEARDVAKTRLRAFVANGHKDADSGDGGAPPNDPIGGEAAVDGNDIDVD